MAHPYITAAEYNTITGRDTAEATTPRLTYASRLLDGRIGHVNAVRESDGSKIDMTELATDYPHRSDAVKSWVAWMTAHLAANDDLASDGSSYSIGRFALNRPPTQADGVPSELRFADAALVTSGIVNRAVSMR